MAKVVITFQDEDSENGFSMVIDLDPPIRSAESATPAQLAAVLAIEAVRESSDIKSVKTFTGEGNN